MTSPTHSAVISYRPDIDGLRAIAVVSVIIFHVNNSWLPGGFLGVDIFFVISGFLITTILAKNMLQHEFSYADFYTRRIRRLMPVFFAVLFFVICVGIILFTAHDLTRLAKSIRYASFFIANFYFSAEQDYFAMATTQMPLLHTWSLAVEEQFYFVWPIILLLILKYIPKYTVLAVIGIIVASIGLGSYLALDSTTASWNFYHLPARMGELLIGGLLALYKPKVRFAELLASIGFLLIILSLFLLSTQSVFPGYNALWPCLGAALIIYSANDNQQTWVYKILALKPMVFIGLLSYSLYLWHWPILAFSRYYNMGDSLSADWIIGCLALTFILSYAVWRWIEQPIRLQRLNFKQTFVRYYLVPLLIVAVALLTIKHTKGYLFDSAAPQLERVVEKNIGCIDEIKKDCSIGAHKPEQTLNNTLLYGDSHARHVSVAFDIVAKKQGWSLDFIGANGCPFLSKYNTFHRKSTDSECRQVSDYVYKHFEQYQNIIIANRWIVYLQEQKEHAFEQELREHLTALTNQGKNIYLIRQIPEYQFDVLKSHRFNKANNRLYDTKLADQLIDQLANDFPNIHIIDLNPLLSQWKNGIIDGKPGYVDNNHINHFAQTKVADYLISISVLNTLQH